MRRALAWPDRRLAINVLLTCLALLLSRELAATFDSLPAHARLAIAGGLWAAGATALGTLPVLLAKEFSPRWHDAALGLGGGVMLAGTVFSLILPAIVASKSSGVGAVSASVTVAFGILLGMALVMLMGHVVQRKNLPNEDAKSSHIASRARAWLFVATVTLHNLPEGWAIGVAYSAVDPLKAHALASGIAIQDLPEGLVVALALRAVGYGRVKAALFGAASGVIEPIGAMAGAMLIDVSAGLLPWGLASAAGAMLYVTCHELIPEAQRGGNCRIASCSFIVGFIVMMMLDTAFS